MNRQDIARQLAAKALTHTLTDAASIMIAADLGAELVAILPQLIAEGLCHVAFTSTPETKFLPPGTDTSTDDDRWHVTLRVSGAPVNFTGLMEQYGSKDVTLQLLDPLLRQAAESGERSLGRMTALRAYIPLNHLRMLVELENFAQSLRRPYRYDISDVLPREYRKDLDTGERMNRPIAVEKWLRPVTAYLRDVIGISQQEIQKVLIEVLGDAKSPESIEKMVSIVGVVNIDNVELAKLLTAQLPTILRLHFNDGARQCKHLDYLVSRGMKWSFSNDVQQVLVDEIAKGNLTLVYQHVTRYAEKEVKKSVAMRGHEQMTHEQMVLQLLPAAFREAMDHAHYGIAAALAQIDPGNVTSQEETMHALEMAIAHGKPIRLNWTRVTETSN